MKRVFLTCCLAILVCGTAWAARRPVTAMDLYRFQWVSDPQISPDGGQVAFVHVTCDSSGDEDGYKTSLWLADTSVQHPAPRQITVGHDDKSPRWSPDGKSLAFLRPAGESEKLQIWLLNMSGGEAVPVTNLPNGSGVPHWSPDGAYIAFTAAIPIPNADNEIRVIRDPEFRDNGRGFKTSRKHVFVLNLRTQEVKQLTDGRFEETFAAWSPESSTIFFLSDHRKAPWLGQADQDLFGIQRRGGEWKTLININGPIHKARVNAKGEWALIGRINPTKAQSYNQLDLLTAPPANVSSPLRTGDLLNRTAALDVDLGNYIATDMASPRASGSWEPVWSNNGKSVYVIMSEKGTSNLVRIDLDDGKVTSLTPGDNAVLSMSATPDAKFFTFVMGNSKNPGDVWLSDDKGKHLKRLTSFNDQLTATLFISGSEHFVVKDQDGLAIDAWLIKPTDYEPWQKHPLIVQIHGGPHIAYGEHFFHEFQVMAGRGYMVLYTNPRGSATYGEEFAQQIQYAYPGGDLYDILAAVDTLSLRSTVDVDRMGVTGGSGGGFLTNWMIVKDHRFKAAATQRCVSDWLSFYFTADFSMYTPFWFKNQPWENPREYIQRSPVYFANRVKTPLLLLHAEDDLRTPINQAEAMFRALRGAGREAVMVRIPGENHNLSRSGRPSNRVARLNYLVDWFDSHLLGKPVEWMETGD